MSNFNDELNRIGKDLMSFFLPRKCPFCGHAMGKEVPCSDCMKNLPFSSTVRQEENYCIASPLYFEGSVCSAVDGYLNKSKIDGLSSFGVLASQCVKDRYDGQFDTITWMPSSKEELRRRKYDANRFLCASVCVDWHTQPAEFLIKENGQINLLPDADLNGKRILLICVEEDKEGLRKCAQELRKAGALEVMVMSLAEKR